MTTIDKAWLAALQQDQEWTSVIPYDRREGGRVVTIKVLRKTATQVVVLVGEIEQRYRMKDGLRVGDNYSEIPTPATEDEIAEARRINRRLNMLARLRDFDFKSLPNETLEAIYKLLPPKTN